MPRTAFVLGLLLLTLILTLSLLPTSFAADQAPIPSATAQAMAEALIKKELYAEHYAKAATSPPAQASLARMLLAEGKDTNDDPAGRYVLFREARDLAARAGDVATALQAIDELGLSFKIPPAEVFRMRLEALTAASDATFTPASYQAVVDAALLLLEEAIGVDDYDSASALVGAAEAAARKLRSVSLVRSVQKRGEEVVRLQQTFIPLKPYADRLRKDPRDPKASLVLGRYYLFIKNNWDRGLTLLAQSDDAQLQALAKQELTRPTEGPAQHQLAQGWDKAAEREKDDVRYPMLARAYTWYQQASAVLDDAARAQAEARMKAILEKLPPEYRPGEIVAELRRLDGHFGPVFSAAFSPDGRKLVSGGADGTVRIWDATTGKEARRLDGHLAPVWCVAYAPDGRHVLSGGFDKSVRLWDPVSGREVRSFAGHDDYVRGVAFSRDGRFLLSGGDDRLLRLWDAASGKQLQVFKGHAHFVWSVALSRDGRRVLSGSLDKTVRLWDAATGDELLKMDGHGDTVLSVAFAPDGRRALSGSTDRTLKLWDLETGKVIRTFTGHQGFVHAVAFAPDGRRALSAGRDNTLRLWDVETGEEVRRLEGHTDQVWAAFFSPDGRWAASCGHDGTLRL